MYKKSFFISEPVSNNAFSFERRKKPRLYVPALVEGGLENVVAGEQVVFEDFDDDGVLRSCKGLANFVRIAGAGRGAAGVGAGDAAGGVSAPIYIFDNHNHAFAFWHDERTSGALNDGAILVHIDGHKDYRMPESFLSREDSRDLAKIFEYTNSVLNVGNFIPPAEKTGLVGEVIFVLSETEIDEFDFGRLEAMASGAPARNLILDIDLDFFAPELDYIGNEKKLALIKRLLPLAKVVTFATSPFFIEQNLAISWLKKIL